MTEKKVDEKVTERSINIVGDDNPAGTNSPQSAPENNSGGGEEHKTEHSTDNQQDAVEKSND